MERKEALCKRKRMSDAMLKFEDEIVHETAQMFLGRG